MNKLFGMRKAIASAFAFVFILAAPTLAFAAGLSVTADPTSVKAGATVTMTIVVSGKHIAVAEGVFTYDPKLLRYASSNGGASDGYINLVSAESGGASSLTAVVKFKAAAEGDVKINVSMKNILDYDGKKLEKPEDAAVLVKVAAREAEPEASNAPSPSIEVAPVDLTQTGVPAKNVKGTDAQMYVWRSLESLTLPSGYFDRQVDYGGEAVGGAAIPDTEFILLYLSEKAGENAGYYVFDTGKDVLYPYVTIASVQASFTILWPDDTIKPPEGFTPATLKWKERDMPAWTAEGSDGAIYLVYARNAAGDLGFFLYNSKDKSVQRYLTIAPAESGSTGKTASDPGAEQKTGSGITIDNTLFIVICAAGLALTAAVVVLLILYVKKNHSKKA